jgi:ribonuclease HII
MAELGDQFPGYGFARHKGYGTPQHGAALAALGPSQIHRLSFAPLQRLAAGDA